GLRGCNLSSRHMPLRSSPTTSCARRSGTRSPEILQPACRSRSVAPPVATPLPLLWRRIESNPDMPDKKYFAGPRCPGNEVAAAFVITRPHQGFRNRYPHRCPSLQVGTDRLLVEELASVDTPSTIHMVGCAPPPDHRAHKSAGDKFYDD